MNTHDDTKATIEPVFLRLGGETTWPNPSDPFECERCLRYGDGGLNRAQQLVAASCISAYAHLANMTVAQFREWKRELKAARAALEARDEG